MKPVAPAISALEAMGQGYPGPALLTPAPSQPLVPPPLPSGDQPGPRKT
jgi:hypothetical protein